MRRMIPVVFSCSLLLAACGGDPQEALLESYLDQASDIGMDMSEAGAKFETLMNLQRNALAWTDAEKEELNSVSQTMAELTGRVQGLTPPDILKDVHPVLLNSIVEMRSAIDGIVTIANDASKATDAFMQEIEDHANAGDALADEFGEKLDAAIAEAYPEMLEE